MHRRSYLASVTTACSAGCLGFAARDVYLGGVRVENGDETPHTVEIRILKDGTRVHETTVDVAAMGETDDGQNILTTAFLSCDWPNRDPGEFELAARLAGDSWVRTTSDAADDDQCQMVFLRVESSDTLWFSWDGCRRYEMERPETVCAYGSE